MVAGGVCMHGFFGGACMVFLGGMVFSGGCVVFSGGGMHGFFRGVHSFFGGGGHAWFFRGEACVVFLMRYGQ